MDPAVDRFVALIRDILLIIVLVLILLGERGVV